MNAWFGPDVAVWFSFLSLLAVTAALAPLAQRGKHRSLVLGTFGGGLVLGVAFLAVGGLALLLDQPWYVPFPFLVTGIAATSAFAGGLRGARRAYQAAEERRILAKDI
jgi:hypothetical protein